MFRIKICGITNVEDAAAAARAGADALGLNFYPKSPRFLTPEAARAVADAVPPGVLKVGLFVNAPAEEVCRTFDELRLDLIQLHGDEPPALLAELAPRPVMRAFRLAPSSRTEHRSVQIGDIETGLEDLGRSETPSYDTGRSGAPSYDLGRSGAPSYVGGLQAIAEYLGECRRLQCVPRMVLVDAGVPGQFGGTGTTADWAALAGHGLGKWDPPLVLAGGLTPQNVAEAIRTVRPSAVDTASGVELSPGRKDHAAMAAFVRAAEEAFGGQGSGARWNVGIRGSHGKHGKRLPHTSHTSHKSHGHLPASADAPKAPRHGQRRSSVLNPEPRTLNPLPPPLPTRGSSTYHGGRYGCCRLPARRTRRVSCRRSKRSCRTRLPTSRWPSGAARRSSWPRPRCPA